MLMCGLAHTINSNSKVHKVHANVWFSKAINSNSKVHKVHANVWFSTHN